MTDMTAPYAPLLDTYARRLEDASYVCRSVAGSLRNLVEEALGEYGLETPEQVRALSTGEKKLEVAFELQRWRELEKLKCDVRKMERGLRGLHKAFRRSTDDRMARREQFEEALVALENKVAAYDISIGQAEADGYVAGVMAELEMQEIPADVWHPATIDRAFIHHNI